MRLWKIRVEHFGPKDFHAAIQGFILRETEEEVLDYVLKTLGCYDDAQLNKKVEVWDDDYENCETITLRESLLRSHGEIDNKNCTTEDAYYGVTFYSWDDVGAVDSDTLIAVQQIIYLRELGLLIDKEG